MINPTAVQEFFEAAFPDDIPSGQYVYLWTLPDKTSYWCKTVAEATAEAVKQAELRADVYVGVGLSSKPLGRKQRVTNANVSGVYGFSADIDYSDNVHAKANLPTLEEAEILILRELKPPTIILNSGHGFQCWWMLKQPFVFEDDGQRAFAAKISQANVYDIREKARAHGWDVDATFDLARVMRMPGTLNRKVAEDIRDVAIVKIDKELRHFVTDFSPSGSIVTEAPPAGVVLGSDLTLDSMAEPPQPKWATLCQGDKRAELSWERKRNDFLDQSGSSYDMSLATLAADAGWTDQEITNLLISSRRKHGDDLKLREDYYARTIARARTKKTTSTGSASTSTAIDTTSPTTIRETISEALGIEIKSITKYVGDPPVYSLTIGSDTETTITLGEVDAITSQRKFRNKVAALANKIVPSFKSIAWDAIAQGLLDILECEDLGEESNPVLEVEAQLSAYLDVYKPSEDWESAGIANRPFIREGVVHISLKQFCYWLRTVDGEKISTKAMARHMRMAGYERVAVNVPIAPGATEYTTRSVWHRTIIAIDVPL